MTKVQKQVYQKPRLETLESRLLLSGLAQPKTYNGVYFPLGDLSFSDRVVSFQPGTDTLPPYSDPTRALGPPTEPPVWTALGEGGVLVVEFVDNVLVDQDAVEGGVDLYIFEIGQVVESFRTEISPDGASWVDLGVLSGQPTAVDIKPFVAPGASFRFVRLTDVAPRQSDAPFAEADIDAVGAIGSSQSDLIANSLAWNTAQAGVDFGYEVAGAALTQDTTAALYWASGTTFDTVIGAPVYDTTIERPVGQYGPFYVLNSVLGIPPDEATHLLLAVDPPISNPPDAKDGIITESNGANNVKAIRLTDIEVLSASLASPASVRFEFATTGNPGHFEVGVYRSTDATFDADDRRIGSLQTITPSLSGGQQTGTLSLPSPLVLDPARPFVLETIRERV